jgi:hypothetical protein
VSREDSVVGVGTGLLAAQLTKLSDCWQQQEIFLYSKASNTDCGAHEASYSVGDADSSPLSSIQITNECI